MPMRFSTEAANADVMGQDTAPDGTPKETSPTAGARGTRRSRSTQTPERRSKSGNANDEEARPGKDINAAGFIKDKDPGKS